jgi:hypothetical protein
MGWWRRRNEEDFLRRAEGRYDLNTDTIQLDSGFSLSGRMLQDLPAKIEGQGRLLKQPIVDMLECEIPGIAHAIYEWFEPESTGELIGELLSSWRGMPDEAAQKSEEDS